jgi:voltage-gated potassium channel
VEVAAKTERRPGQPRSERDAAYLDRFNTRMQLPILVSAILPLLIVPQSDGWAGVVVGVATWLVFLADYVVHARHLEHYGRTRLGRFDLFVVIATAPWFLLPGAQAGLPPDHPRPANRRLLRPPPATPRCSPWPPRCQPCAIRWRP